MSNSTTARPDQPGDNVIKAGVLGGALVLIVIAVIIVLLTRKRSRKETINYTSEKTDNDLPRSSEFKTPVLPGILEPAANFQDELVVPSSSSSREVGSNQPSKEKVKEEVLIETGATFCNVQQHHSMNDTEPVLEEEEEYPMYAQADRRITPSGLHTENPILTQHEELRNHKTHHRDLGLSRAEADDPIYSQVDKSKKISGRARHTQETKSTKEVSFDNDNQPNDQFNNTGQVLPSSTTM